MKLNVPYYSQFLDVDDAFWNIRSCGAICFKMIADYHFPSGESFPDIVSFCNTAKEEGGYDMKNGWVHDYIIRKAEELGLEAHRMEGLSDINEIVASLQKGNPVIVSVEKRLLEQTRFHMIVIVGYDENGFMYHEPESTDRERGAYRVCDESTFLNYWRGKAIFVSSVSA